MKLTGGQALARQLEKEGLTDVFGVPGVQLDWAVDGIRELEGRVRMTIPRHEQATSYMADGYARSTGRIGVCMTVPGPGMMNAMAGLATAYACSSPVLAIVGQTHSASLGGGYGMLHEVRNQSDTLASVTKWRGMALTPESIPALVRQAVRALRTDRPQPVGIEIPHDVLSRTADVTLIDPPDAEDGRRAPDPQSIARAAALLSAARFPVICAGGGVLAADASVALTALAEKLQAPVVTAEMGRGAISDHHPMALNSVGGRAVMRHADVVLVVGSRFMSRMAVVPAWTDRAVTYVYLNIEPADTKPPRKVDVFIHADARLGLEALAAEIEGGRPSRGALMDAVRAWAERQMAAVEPQYGYVRALRRAIPEDGFLVTELTQVGYFTTIGYPVYRPRSFIAPGYQGTLGYGFPTALGVAAANPGSTVVSINGDGGFGWSLQELATARKHDLGVVIVVFNDGHFGNVRLLQDLTFGKTFGVELCNPDFPKLADAFGIASRVTTDPEALEREVRAAGLRGGPTLIEARVGRMPNAWHLYRLRTPFKPPVAEEPDPVDAFPGAADRR